MSTTTSDPTLTVYRRLVRTVNLAPNLGSPNETGWTIDIDRSHLAACAEHGFTAIRLLIGLAWHRGEHGLKPDALRRIESIVDDATDEGLAVVVANHRDDVLTANPDAHLAAAVADVRQVATVLAGRESSIVFEPLAEPMNALNPMWNTTAALLIDTVREQDRDRTLMIGPHTRNNARFLGELSLPETETNLIVGVHHYWPTTFTMQGETWLGQTELGVPADWLGTTWDGTASQQTELRAGFDAIATWSAATGRPVCLAEFGTSANADLASRVRWTRFNRRLAEERGMSWGIWSLGPIFSIYDLKTRTFDPDLLAALMHH